MFLLLDLVSFLILINFLGKVSHPCIRYPRLLNQVYLLMTGIFSERLLVIFVKAIKGDGSVDIGDVFRDHLEVMQTP